MRKSPAYFAIQQLPRCSPLKSNNNVRALSTLDQKRYFYIAPKTTEHAIFTLSGVGYEIDLSREPHLSVYEDFKLSEAHGLSVFHFTCYAFCQEIIDQGPVVAAAAGGDMSEKRVRHQVVIHVYFNQASAYLYSQVKKESARAVEQGGAAAAMAAAASTSDIIPLTPVEESDLRRYAIQQANPLIFEILQSVHKQVDQARQKAERGLKALKTMPLGNERQRHAYLHKVRSCIKDFEATDALSFSRTDPRLSYLRSLISTQGHHLGDASQATAAGSPALFSKADAPSDEDDAAESAASAAAAPRPKHATPQQRAAALKRRIAEHLKAVDEKLQALQANTAKNDVTKAIEKYQLLQSKIPLIAEGMKHVSGDVAQAVFQAMTEHHQDVQVLFKEKALAGDLVAVEALIAFVDDIDDFFAFNLVVSKHIPVIKRIIQEFDSFMKIVNHVGYFASEGIGKDKKFSIMCLLVMDPDPQALPLFNLLLERGADVEFSGSTEAMRSMGTLLSIASVMGLQDHVHALFSYGAVLSPQLITTKNITSFSALNGASLSAQLRGLEHLELKDQLRGKKESSSMIPPLYLAVMSGHHGVVREFIRAGVVFSGEQKYDFDVLAIACCNADSPPSDEMLAVLIEQGGANVNAIFSENKITALEYQIVRDRPDTAKALLKYGADPNIVRESSSTLGAETAVVLSSVFLKAVQDLKPKFVEIFLQNTGMPVSIYSFVIACGFCFAPGIFSFSITNTLEIVNLVDDVKEVKNFPGTLEEAASFKAIALLLAEHMPKVRARTTELSAAVVRSLREVEKYKDFPLFAVRFYMVSLLFGNDNQRHRACCNIAICFERKGSLPIAFQFYDWASKYDPLADIKALANKGAKRVAVKVQNASTAAGASAMHP